MTTNGPVSRRPRVVIVGAGFGGLSAAMGLAKARVDVVIVDRRNYHLFQPLLYQVATAGLSPADIASPIRGIVRKQFNASVRLGRVTAIDTAGRKVIADGRAIPYDYLIVATGARHAYFGRDDWEEFAHGIKKIDDATFLRHKILIAFEKAETETDPAERKRLLNFVVVGGGPTGVEMAGAIAELARKALASDFRTIDPRAARIVLVEAGPRLLPSFHPSLSEAARRSLEALGVEVRLSGRVTGCDAGGVIVGNERIEARTVVWGAGVRASPAGKWFDADVDGVGRVKIGPDLSLPGYPEVFVIGDTAHAVGADGKPLPGVAPVAKQQGQYVARVIAARLAGRDQPPFKYRNYGSMATIGRKSAVVEYRNIRMTGFPAWLLWGLAHIYFLIGYRNRIVVGMNWAWNYLTFQRGTRLITGVDPETAHAAGTGSAGRASDSLTAMAGTPIHRVCMASRTNAPTAGE